MDHSLKAILALIVFLAPPVLAESLDDHEAALQKLRRAMKMTPEEAHTESVKHSAIAFARDIRKCLDADERRNECIDIVASRHIELALNNARETYECSVSCQATPRPDNNKPASPTTLASPIDLQRPQTRRAQMRDMYLSKGVDGLLKMELK